MTALKIKIVSYEFFPTKKNAYKGKLLSSTTLLSSRVSWIYKSFFSFLKKTIPVVLRRLLHTKFNAVIKTSRRRLVSLLSFVRNHLFCQYNVLLDIIVYETRSTNHKYVVIYNLLSKLFNTRLFICINTSKVLQVSSVCSLYASANWLERESWDFFGVFFFQHPDLRRLLTDYGFSNHPLRKDFPLSGYKEISYSEKEKRIIYSTVELSQICRIFSFKLGGEKLGPK